MAQNKRAPKEFNDKNKIIVTGVFLLCILIYRSRLGYH